MKLRAWNNKENRWVTNKELLNDIQVSATLNPPSILEISHSDWVFNLCMEQEDKNGRLIYDGDIIDFTFFYYREYEIETHKRGEVIFHDNMCFMFAVSDDEMYDFSQLSYDSINDIEVIGNIYENPHIVFSKDLNEL